MREIPASQVKQFESEFLDVLAMNHADVLATLKAGKLTDEVTSTLKKVASDLVKKFKA